jgi:aminoglycoside phosphotransferase (APT) family kinase protein
MPSPLLGLPKPLLFDQDYNATFYEGPDGHNLYYSIKQGDRNTLERMLPVTAAWFARLHALPVAGLHEGSFASSRIKDVVPGMEYVIDSVQAKYPAYAQAYTQIFDNLNKQEEAYFAGRPLCLVHGDAHPENVIVTGEHSVTAIDFTDLCLSDPARDLGSFIQQLEFMVMKRLGDQPLADWATGLFLEKYLEQANIKNDNDLRRRTEAYYCWTAMRTATFFLMKHEPQPHRSTPLINSACARLGIAPVPLIS